MIDKAFFQDTLSAFSNRFKDHSYDEYLVDLLYEDLNYLTANQLEIVLKTYFKKVNSNYFLPPHKTLLALAVAIFPLPEEVTEKKVCDYCRGIGKFIARNKKYPSKYIKFRCNCKAGEFHTALNLWKEEYQEKFLTEYEHYQKMPPVNLESIINRLSPKSIKGDLPKNMRSLDQGIVEGLREVIKKEKKANH